MDFFMTKYVFDKKKNSITKQKSKHNQNAGPLTLHFDGLPLHHPGN